MLSAAHGAKGAGNRELPKEMPYHRFASLPDRVINDGAAKESQC